MSYSSQTTPNCDQTRSYPSEVYEIIFPFKNHYKTILCSGERPFSYNTSSSVLYRFLLGLIYGAINSLTHF